MSTGTIAELILHFGTGVLIGVLIGVLTRAVAHIINRVFRRH